MNRALLKKYVEAYKKWCTGHLQTVQENLTEQQESKETYAAYTKGRILAMDEDELYNYIAPLWSMAMWGNKHYQIDNIIQANGIPLIQKQLANLIWGNGAIETRWDDFRSKIKGVGPAIMSELLFRTHPDQFVYWNKKTANGFQLLEIQKLPRYDYQLNGKTYQSLCERAKEVRVSAQTDGCPNCDNMMGLNYFLWQIQQQPLAKPTANKVPEIETPLPKEVKDGAFIHNDIRDKLADIGRFLGFRAEVEKKVADGAVVDAIGEVTIGNMGRVVYVFEVQTSGSIDSLILNLMKAKNNKSVQGIVAVTDQKQIEKIKKEVSTLPIKNEIKFWDYAEVLRVHESLQYVNESINNLGLVPAGL